MASNISTSSSSKESTNSETENDNSKDSNDKKESNLCPFKLLYSFGINPEVPVLNLITENRTIIAYACSHAVILYNYKTKETINLQGHKNTIRTISISADGKWLLSADFENDCVVVVWDTETGVPIRTLFSPHGEFGMTAARISPNARYLVTVGNETHQKVYFWLWTYGRDEPDGLMEMADNTISKVKHVAFDDNHPEQFVLTADDYIVFCCWENRELKSYYPQVLGKVRRYGIFNCSCYVSKTNLAVTGTAHGYLLSWSSVDKSGNATTSNMKKKHIKYLQLHKCSITMVLHHEGLVVLGTAEGRLCFYNHELKILYSYQNPHLDSIRSISYELRTSLLGPVPMVSDSELEFSEDENIEYEGEFEKYSESKHEDSICDEKIEYFKKLESIYLNEVPSPMTVNMEIKLRHRNKSRKYFNKFDGPTDATLENAPFHTRNFIVSSSNGSIALINIPQLKCQFIFKDMSGPITSLDAHPRSDFIVTGNVNGLVSLYDYEKRQTILRQKTPPLPDFRLLLENQVKWGVIVYATCPDYNENLTAITVLKYSPLGDLLACGLENGALWMMHPITLEPIDTNPYKHSTETISKLVFTDCAEYMAYMDVTSIVAVFKKNSEYVLGKHMWNFIGKYRVHDGVIRDLLFAPATTTSHVPRLFSLGEDQNLIEYDLKKSGPYPEPGLIVAGIHKIEYTATPLCLAWYPQMGVETFLMISNSEFKHRLLNDVTKLIRGTFLGPLFGTPVRYFKVLPTKELKGGGYLVFATETEIGLQIYPFDGNPYKILGIIGHPRKITNIAVNCNGNILFTSGYDDPSVLMWKIKCRSVDVLAHLGGEGLNPYYCLIQGGKKGWLIGEMRDLFYYAQILHQGENTCATRIVSEKISTKQIPNLMRAIGYYPSNEEIEILMGEISYRNYANTGQFVEEITFEEFVKYYINHRPAFGISIHRLKEAFQIFANSYDDLTSEKDNPVLTREQFLKVLFGEGPDGMLEEKGNLFGEPMTVQEAHLYLKLLIDSDDHLEDLYYRDKDRRSTSIEFSFLPQRISYKDFTTNIMGIELPEETKADD